tara:strand:- start:2269 stop:3627 length:1359 start_codon:yes stop_codon:yes gene_type:complete
VSISEQKSPELSAISVSQLNRKVKQLLEQGLTRLWIEGEISNLARPASGHLYFTLKDDGAQVRAAFFRQRQRGPNIGLKNGDKVLAYGRVGLYEPRGDYQLIVERVEPAGEGALKREFDKLKRKLQAEGLFDDALKQPLPALPSRIGVITSPTGAAIRDILSVLRRRFPAIPVTIYPSAVQGDAAPGELLAALNLAVQRDECDVLLLTRGGGSLEDLWAFNDETLARAIVSCPIPLISAVGHEADFTIADFVADVRAPTPSGAAEIAVPDSQDILRNVNALALRIGRLGRRALEDRAQTLDWLGRRLLQGSPAASVARQADRLREYQGRLRAAVRDQLAERNEQLHALHNTVLQLSPAIRIERLISRNNTLTQRLAAAGTRSVADLGHRLRLAAKGLHAVSPLATLDRGYAIVTDAENGRALLNTGKLKPGDEVRARLHDGEFLASVRKILK